MEERRVKALELRKAGLSYRAIAAALDVSEPTAHKDVHTVLARLAKQADGKGEEYRQLELERLDALIASVWSQARGNKKEGIPPDLAAMDRLMRLMQQRARLMGLDAPVTVKHTGTGKDGEIEFNVNDARDEIQRKLAGIAAAIGADGIPGQSDAE